MIGRQIIDAIQEYHLEDLDIYSIDTDMDSKLIIEFDNGDIELPYPEYKDAHFNDPAHVYKYKVLEIDDEGVSKCYDKELNTSKPYW